MSKRKQECCEHTGKPSKKKADRAKMKGVSCPCCDPYYSALGLSPKSKEAHINEVSRHRYEVPPPRTPEHYWDVDFPSSAECARRGYSNKTDEPYRFKRKSKTKLYWWKNGSEGAEAGKKGEKEKGEDTVAAGKEGEDTVAAGKEGEDWVEKDQKK